jgi:Txe/YoeB family toxin of toxin-antitoxin system
MNAITYTAARENLASTMDQVCLDRDPVIITRKREQSVVMISLEDYEALEETAYLLLIQDILRSPQEGIGKPESLKHNLSGYWSRRITEEHRIVYKQFEHGITFVQMRYHYK